MLYSDWGQAQANFPAERQAAIDNATCFCRCGCRAGDVWPVRVVTGIRPALCGKCDKSRSATHGLAVEPVNIYRDPFEATPARTRNILARLISPDRRAEATEYAREYGTEGGVFMSAMCERVRSGKHLTATQTDAVIRSREADRRSAKSALRRTLAEQARAATAVDLLRVVIPKTLAARRYAVQGDSGDWCIIEVERPRTGALRGFVVVRASLGEGMTKFGVQYPQPAHTTPAMLAQGYVQSYRGNMPQLVYRLVKDPKRAAADYESLMGKPE